jgi:hypothetical protein
MGSVHTWPVVRLLGLLLLLLRWVNLHGTGASASQLLLQIYDNGVVVRPRRRASLLCKQRAAKCLLPLHWLLGLL